MIEASGNMLRVTSPMLIADASALLETGRDFLRSAAKSATTAAAAAAALVIDLSSVEETDSSALSVIFGLLRTARECGVTLQIANPPASMVSQAALYGVSDVLPLA